MVPWFACAAPRRFTRRQHSRAGPPPQACACTLWSLACHPSRCLAPRIHDSSALPPAVACVRAFHSRCAPPRYIAAGKLRRLLQAWHFTDFMSNELVDLVTRMLTIDPARRITLPEVLQHPWLAPEHHHAHAAAVGEPLPLAAAAAAGAGLPGGSEDAAGGWPHQHRS